MNEDFKKAIGVIHGNNRRSRKSGLQKLPHYFTQQSNFFQISTTVFHIK